jgi:hypothetical protein
VEKWQAQFLLFVRATVYDSVHQELEASRLCFWIRGGGNLHGAQRFLGASSDYHTDFVWISQIIGGQWFVLIKISTIIAIFRNSIQVAPSMWRRKRARELATWHRIFAEQD